MTAIEGVASTLGDLRGYMHRHNDPPLGNAVIISDTLAKECVRVIEHHAKVLDLLPQHMFFTAQAIAMLEMPAGWSASLGWRDWSIGGREYVINLKHGTVDWFVDCPVCLNRAPDGPTWLVQALGEFDDAQEAVDRNIERYERMFFEREGL